MKQLSNAGSFHTSSRHYDHGLKEKDLCLIPWRLAIALQADGWWVRSVICWAKKSTMPESVTDRPTSSWEPIFLLAKSARYFYDAEAVRENFADERMGNPGAYKWKYGEGTGKGKGESRMLQEDGTVKGWYTDGAASGRNQRNVWHLGPEPYSDAHFATFPSEIPKRAIMAGSRPGDTVLDPFFGSGTVGQVAELLNRKWIGIELNPEYVRLAERRVAQRGLAL